MTQEVELQIGIPDYYREDLDSHEFDKYLEDALVESQALWHLPSILFDGVP